MDDDDDDDDDDDYDTHSQLTMAMFASIHCVARREEQVPDLGIPATQHIQSTYLGQVNDYQFNIMLYIRNIRILFNPYYSKQVCTMSQWCLNLRPN